MYEVETEDYKDQEIIGGDHPIVVGSKVVKTGVSIKKNAPVKLVDGLIEPVTKGASDAETAANIYGIAVEAAESESEALVYLTGKYQTDELALESGVTANMLDVAFRQIGIFLV